MKKQPQNRCKYKEDYSIDLRHRKIASFFMNTTSICRGNTNMLGNIKDPQSQTSGHNQRAGGTEDRWTNFT